MRKKILIIGHARHGKDTVAQFLKDLYGYEFKSSSQAASEIFLYDRLKVKYGYKTPEECFEDRVNHRAEWHDLICDFNKDDHAKLAKAIMSTNDIYVGMRSNREAESCIEQGVFDLILGVFNPMHPLEPRDSFDIDLWQKSDLILSNSGTLADLERKIKNLSTLFEK